MIPTPNQPYKRYGIGGVNYHTGETMVIVRRRKRRSEIAEFLELLLEKHPHETVYVALVSENALMMCERPFKPLDGVRLRGHVPF